MFNPSDPFNQTPPSDPFNQTNPYIQAVLALLAASKQQAPAPIQQPRHYGPAEGPLGENAHLGWGLSPRTAPSPRRAAPTPRTKLGGVVGGVTAPKTTLAPAAVIHALLAGSTPRYIF